MKKNGAFILVALLATPGLMSAQGMGHQHQQGRQQMHQMQEMDEMAQRMAQMHEQIQGLLDLMGHDMGRMNQMTEAQHMQHQQIQGMTEAMGEVAGQMHSAMMRMIQLGEGPAMHEDLAMHQDMEQLRGHMQSMTEGMEAGLEVMQRVHKRMGGGGPMGGSGGHSSERIHGPN
jgi:septation ring formation regulator EzrA